MDRSGGQTRINGRHRRSRRHPREGLADENWPETGFDSDEWEWETQEATPYPL